MQLPCEAGVKMVVPAIRALLSKELVEQYGMNESQTATILGLSQSAISRYKSKNRANILKTDSDHEIHELIDQMIKIILYGDSLDTFKILDLFCKTCNIVRKKGLLCSYCQQKTKISIPQNCNFCFSKKSC